MKCNICKAKTRLKYKKMFDNRHGYPKRFSVFQCQNCGFMQTKPQLTFRELSNIYTNYYPKRDADIKQIIKYSQNIPTKSEITRNGLATTCHFQTKKGQKVMDVGCGTCQSLLEIKRLGGEAWGIDPDKNSQVVAKKLKLKFHLGTIHNCNFPKHYFDLITASQVLEHEGNPLKFLRDCITYLKPNGKIILSFPNTGSLYRKLWGKNWLHWHLPYHLNHFNKKSLKILIEESGLKITELKTVTPNLWTILQIRSYLNSPKAGERDTMWDGKSNIVSNDQKTPFFNKFLTNALPLAGQLFFINRLLDRLGFGESFVITLVRP